MMPPNAASVTASTRNCSSTSRAIAPTARRVPISRVRSVTDTSMMFMMPTPPTIRLTAATAPSSAVSTRVELVNALRDLLEVAHVEIVVGAVANLAPLAQQRFDVGLHFLGRDAVARRDHDRVDVGVAGHAPLQRAQRHDDDVVLVLAEARLALRPTAAPITWHDSLPSRMLDADRILSPNSSCLHRVAEQADRGAGAQLGSRRSCGPTRAASRALRGTCRWCR